MRRLHLGRGDLAETVCAHVGGSDASFSSACIPLTTLGESLGWLYLSSPGLEPLPRLNVAVAARNNRSSRSSAGKFMAGAWGLR